jgi:dihydrofolate synthase/folylpolyglutamate synthase
VNYKQSLKYVYSLESFGIHLGLERIRFLLKKLGNPEKKMKIIHVAGTNGKGSVCAMLGSVLRQKYRVGVYTSPNLVDIRERITVNGRMISKKDFSRIMSEIKKIDAPTSFGHPTFFETLTALSLEYFYEKKVDFAVLETGLGGRLDATNIVKPLISVITNVSMEHENILGKNIKKIASEKAGIIKKGVPVVTSAKNKKVLEVIKNVCRRKKCKLVDVYRTVKIKKVSHSLDGQFFNLQTKKNKYPNLRIPLLGKHQLVNAATALSGIEVLGGFSEMDVRKGFSKIKWPGRLEIISRNPLIVVDGAHNPDGMKKLKKAVMEYFNYNKLILVLGILSDKDIKKIIKIISPLTDRIVITKPGLERAADPEIIKNETEKYIRNIVVKENVKNALDYAKSFAKKNDMILITGSLYTVGDVKKVMASSCYGKC